MSHEDTEAYNASLYFTKDQEHTVSSLISQPHPTPGNVGVCLSGGGSRALTCGMGQLRALKHLQQNGTSLLNQIKALSTVSGGSWVGAPFLYLHDATSDTDYLNEFVANQSRLVPTRKTGHSLAETLDELPPNNIGQGPSDLSFSPPALAISALILHKFFQVPVDMLWQTLVGWHILKDYQLYEPKAWHKAPTSFYAYNREQLDQEVLQDNPNLKAGKAQLYISPCENRVHRPFLICNFSMFVKLPNEKQEFLAPVQATPFFTGIVGNPGNAKDANNQPVGGEGVTAFAFNSDLTSEQQLQVTINQQRNWSLTDAVGSSSAFFAEKVNEIFNEMRANPDILHQHLEQHGAAAVSWIENITPIPTSGIVGKFKKWLNFGVEKVTDRLFSEAEISTILEDIGDLVPEYLYWRSATPTPDGPLHKNRFADGGNLENTGIASLLSYQDIDKIIAFVNTSTPLTQGDKGVLDTQGNEIPGTRIVVDSQVPPLFGYQPYKKGVGYQLYANSHDPEQAEFKFNQVFECTDFADFLIRIWLNSGNAENPGSNQRPAICKQTLRVLPNSWFGVKGRGGPNDEQGKIKVVWYYNNAARAWYDSLNSEVKDLLGDFDDPSSFNNFPHYSTFSSHLTKTEINLLANYTCWAVSNADNAKMFKDLFS